MAGESGATPLAEAMRPWQEWADQTNGGVRT